VLAALGPWLGHLDPTDPELEHHRLEALWLCETLDDPNWGLVASLLEANDPRVRAAATRALRNWRGRIDGVLPLLERRVSDPNPRVRLEAVRALGDLPGPRTIEIAMTALDGPIDTSLEYALHLTANQLEPVWLPAFESGEVTFGGSLRRLEYALQAVGSARVVRPLVQLIRSGKVPPQREQQVLILVAAYGGPEELDLVLKKAIDLVASDSEGAARLLAALARASRDGKSAPPPGAPRIASLLESAAEPIACEAARLAGAWKLEALRAKLLELAGANASTSRRREAALEGVASLGGPASIDALSRVAGDEKEAATMRLHAAGLLATLDAARGASAAADTLAAIRRTSDPAECSAPPRAGGRRAVQRRRALSGDIAKVGIRVASTYP
jgi:HEAT repeat protein